MRWPENRERHVDDHMLMFFMLSIFDTDEERYLRIYCSLAIVCNRPLGVENDDEMRGLSFHHHYSITPHPIFQ